MSDETNINNETNINEPETVMGNSASEVWDIAAPAISPKDLKNMSPRKRQEFLAMCQWLGQNSPGFQEAVDTMNQKPKGARLIRKGSHHRKTRHHGHRQRF